MDLIKPFLEYFFLIGPLPENIITGEYNLFLVSISYFIASLGAFIGLHFSANMLQTASKKQQNLLHISGALAFGSGIWSMHFIGMLAYQMDMVHTYDPLLTFISMVIAIFIAYFVLQIIRKPKLVTSDLIISATLLGTAICIMHYMGMAAMEMDAELRYHASYFLISMAIAITASIAALLIVFKLGHHSGKKKLLLQVIAALIMGLAVCGMHYTGMMAAVFIPYADCRFDPNQSFEGLAAAVTIISGLIFMIALTVSLYDTSEKTTSPHRQTNLEKHLSGNSILIRLSSLLAIFLILLIGSYFFLNANSKEREENYSYLKVAHAQKLLLLTYTQNNALKNNQAQATKKAIETNYLALLNGGFGMLDPNKKTNFILTSDHQPEHRKILNASLNAWEKAKGANTTKQKHSLLETIPPLQEQLIEAINQQILRNQNNFLLKQQIILSLGFITFLMTILYARFFIINPIDKARFKLQENRDTLEKRVAQQTKKLRHAKEKAEIANQAKSDFLANMSHEIRTPMNAIIGLSDFICTTELNDEQQECANAIKTSGRTLLHIINDIIDLSKIEAGKLTLEEIEFNLEDTLQETISLYSHQARDKNLDIELDIPSDFPTLFLGDPVRIKQIFSNLISNALKFTNEGYVRIKIKERKSHYSSKTKLICSVEDTGIGIAKDKQKHVFLKFSQAEASTTRNFGGTGLGLTIVKQLLDLMHGSISVSSELGKGTTFKFDLTLPVINKEIELNEHLEHKIGRVLIIDDYALNRTLLAAILSRRNIDYDFAENAKEALKKIKKNTYSACLVDYILGDGMNGLELIEKVRKTPKYDDLAMILISGQVKVQNIENLRELGVDGCFERPFDAEEIITSLKISVHNKMEKNTDIPLITYENIQKLSVLSQPKKTSLTQQYAGKKVLAVDDTKINMLVIKKALKKFNVDIDTAYNGLEAVNKAKENDYDIIFMDCHMPEMDGLEATTKIREFEQENNKNETPIVALTADAMVGDREKCLSFGMNDYLNKPFRDSEITEIMHKWVK